MPKFTSTGEYVSELDKEWDDLYTALEEKLNIDIAFQLTEGDKTELLNAAAMAGTKICDLFQCRQPTYWTAAKAGYILPVDGDKLKDLGLDSTDETRWFQPSINETNAFGHNWGLRVASKFVAVPTGYFVTFNKEMVKAAGYDDLYSMVRNGTWTWDKYLDIASKTTKDTNGDNVNDIWGTGATAWGNEITTNGSDFVGPDSTGKWVVLIDSQAGVDSLNFLLEMNANGTRLDDKSGVCRQAFADGTICFNWAGMGHINGPTQIIYNSSHDYGIIPMPKGPNATGYVAAHDDNDTYCIQSTNKDLEKVVPILNEWALIVNDTENYLEVLDDGRCRTEEDKEMMIDYIIPNFKLAHQELPASLTIYVKELDYTGDLSIIIDAASYGSMTPRQALDSFAGQIQSLLDEFFNS
jgi:hypothetical protein